MTINKRRGLFDSFINKAWIKIFISSLALLLLNGCGTDPKKKMTYGYLNSTVEPIGVYAADEFYEKKLVGKIVIWTDSDFLISSKLNNNQLSYYRNVKIFGEGSVRVAFITLTYENRFVIHMPPGKIKIRTSEYTNHETEFVLKGGETNSFYWKNPESKLIEGVNKPSSLRTQDVILSYIGYDELMKKYSPKLELANEISKDETQVLLKFRITEDGLIKKFTINNFESPFKKNEEFTLVMPLKFGNNEFSFLVENEHGFESRAKFEFTRLTNAEKKKIADEIIAEKKRIAETERLEKIRIANEEKARKVEIERIAREGDGSADDLLCKKYGLKPQTNGYAECRMRIDLAKRESMAAQEKYNIEKAAYDRQMEAIQKEREQQRAMRQLELGLRMMGGQSPVNAMNSLGTNAPIAPTMPTPINQTITMPSGRMITCTTMGTMTNCN